MEALFAIPCWLRGSPRSHPQARLRVFVLTCVGPGWERTHPEAPGPSAQWHLPGDSPPAEQTSIPPIRLPAGTWLPVTALNALRRTEGRVAGGRKWPKVSFQPDVPAQPDPLPRPCCSPLPLAILGRSESSWSSTGSIPARQHGVFGVGSLWATVVAVSLVGG